MGIYAFVDHANFQNVANSLALQLHQRLEEVGSFSKLTKAERESCYTLFNELWHYEAYQTGRYKLMGFVFDFRPWMNTYWVQYRYHGIAERMAFNKTTLRKWATNPSDILKIVQITGKEEPLCACHMNNSTTDDTAAPSESVAK